MAVAANVDRERELCRAKSVWLCLSVRRKQRTFATQQKLILNTVDATDSGRVLSLLRRIKAERFVAGAQKAQCVQRLRGRWSRSRSRTP